MELTEKDMEKVPDLINLFLRMSDQERDKYLTLGEGMRMGVFLCQSMEERKNAESSSEK